MPTPLINGTNYVWANIKFNLFGVPVVGITSINYDTTQKKENNYGAGTEPVSRGYGNKEYKCSIEIYKDEWQRIIAATTDRDPLNIKPFDIQVLFGDSKIKFSQDNLLACEFTNNPFEAKQGDTKLMVKLDLIVGMIKNVA